MLKNRSLKTKIVLTVISALLMTTILLLSVTGIIVGKQVVELSTTCLSMKLSGDIQSSWDYLKAYFGSLKYENNRLIDSNNNPIDKWCLANTAIEEDNIQIGSGCYGVCQR